MLKSMFDINFNDKETEGIIKFKFPVNISTWLHNFSSEFIYALHKIIGGKIVTCDSYDDFCFVLYKGYYIDYYGIHTIDGVYNRKLSLYDFETGEIEISRPIIEFFPPKNENYEDMNHWSKNPNTHMADFIITEHILKSQEFLEFDRTH